jgi:integrase
LSHWVATGLRAGEARGLRWADVDLDAAAPAIQVRQHVIEVPGQGRMFEAPKSQHGRRTIPLIPIAVSALQAQHRRVSEMRLRAGPLWQGNDLVFPAELGEPLLSRRLRDRFTRIARQAGLKNVTPHTLRHSTGTFLLAAGVPDRTVQAILGHGSAAMTRHYLHVMPAMLTDAGSRLVQFLAAAGS